MTGGYAQKGKKTYLGKTHNQSSLPNLTGAGSDSDVGFHSFPRLFETRKEKHAKTKKKAKATITE